MGEARAEPSASWVTLRAGDASAPLVCLHGFMGSPTAFASLVERSRHPGPILALVLPGHGPAPWGIGDAEPDALEAMAARLPTGGAHLVGYSMGGRVALALAALRPERVLSVVAIGAHAGLEGAVERAERLELDRARARALCQEGLPGFVDAWERLPLFATQEQLSASVRASIRAERLAHTPDGLARALETLSSGAMPASAAALAATRIPVLSIVGSLDAAYVAHARALSRANPAVEVAVVKGAGHNVLAEAPRDLALLVDRAIASAARRPRPLPAAPEPRTP